MSRHRSCDLFSLATLSGDERMETFYLRSNKLANDNEFAIAYIGQDEKRDDILLRKSRYRGRCYFTITKAGDLLLCDAGHDLEPEDDYEIHPTILSVTDSDGPVEKFRIRGIGDCCVLPFSRNYRYTIKLPNGQKFALHWDKGVDWRYLLDTRDLLRAEYRVRSITSPEEVKVTENSRAFDVKQVPCRWTPELRNSQLYAKDTHRYGLLHQDRLSIVDVAVDIRDGKEYAVKTIARTPWATQQPSDDMLNQFKREVEIGALLSHDHILVPKHHQGWALSRGPELFYTPYDGTVLSMVNHERHRKEAWGHLPQFVEHTLRALDFMHRHNMTHSNVGLDRIVFKNEGSSTSFLLSGLEIASRSHSREWQGNPRYMAPEVFGYARGRLFNGPPADIYSFGVALLEFLGMLRPDDNVSRVSNWWSEWQTERGCREGYVIAKERASRVESLRADSRLRYSILKDMLNSNPSKRPPAREALHELRGKALEELARHCHFRVTSTR